MSSYFCNREAVIEKLIKLRCHYADKLAKNVQDSRYLQGLNKPKYDHPDVVSDKVLLYSLFPPRSKWCSLGIRGNYRGKDSAEKRNQRALRYTYWKARKNQSTEQWYVDLTHYADVIMYAIEHPSSLARPRVVPTPKEGKPHEFRPICSFCLKERVVLSMLNKRLVGLLDKQFLDCSYAFRARNHNENCSFMHLPAVLKLQEFRKNHLDQVLYVAECDMKKFYDTINHKVIADRFDVLLEGVQDIDENEKELYRKWMQYYLDCYNFYDDVYTPSQQADSSLWSGLIREKDEEDRIPWVSECEQLQITQKQEIGVPQGGALSTLIANIVLHTVDAAVMKAIGEDPNMLYMRFCDDMFLVGNDKAKTQQVFEVYQDAVRQSQLYPHPNEEMKGGHDKDFWNGKTRGPYAWGDVKKGYYPWVTFVGFECNWRGELRIRKSSFKKEYDKQEKVVREIIVPLRTGKVMIRSNKKALLGFIEKRLIAMSVGRVSMRNYKETENDHSWMSAYSILDSNKWSRAQMRSLDHHRKKMMVVAETRIPDKPLGVYGKSEHSKKECVFHGKPFSYYGQCFSYKHK